MEKYISKIIAEFNEHAAEAERLAETAEIGTVATHGFHAFMANAISAAIRNSTNDELKRRFSQEAFS